jgi:beta-galactosidase GanA
MPGLGPGIHVFLASPNAPSWMAGTSPAMTMTYRRFFFSRTPGRSALRNSMPAFSSAA